MSRGPGPSCRSMMGCRGLHRLRFISLIIHWVNGACKRLYSFVRTSGTGYVTLSVWGLKDARDYIDGGEHGHVHMPFAGKKCPENCDHCLWPKAHNEVRECKLQIHSLQESLYIRMCVGYREKLVYRITLCAQKTPNHLSYKHCRTKRPMNEDGPRNGTYTSQE